MHRFALPLLLVALLAGASVLAGGPVEAAPADTAEARRLTREAQGFLDRGETTAAAERLAQAVAADPGLADAWALRGRVAALDRRHRAAEEALRRAVELGAGDLATLYYLGSALWENGDGEAAEEVLLGARAAHGDSVALLQQLGRLRIWRGRYEEAVEPLAAAAAAVPAAGDLAADLARAWAGAGKPEAALVSWRRAVAAAPEHSGYRYGLARALAGAGERTAAEEQLAIFRRLVEADQERTRRDGLERARIDRGWQLLREGKATQAAAHLATLPVSPDSLAARAAAYRALGDRAAALDALERAVALAPGREDLRARLSEERLAAGGSP